MHGSIIAPLLAGMLVSMALPAQADSPGAGERGLALGAVATAPELSARLDAQLETNRERYGIAGQAVLVAHNGTIVYQAEGGERDRSQHAPVTADTVFGAQSLAKLFTSTLVMQLVDEGALDLDAPASRHVPNLPAAWQAIPVRDFLNHSSGVAEYFEDRNGHWTSKGYIGLAPTLAAALAVAGDAPMLFVPGSRVRYTQTNFLVLSALLEAHYRQPYPTIARRRILQPLELRSTWLGKPGVPRNRAAVAYVGRQGALQAANEEAFKDYGYGHSDLQTTVADMNRFLQALAAGKLVRPATLEALWQPQVLSSGSTNYISSGWDTLRNDGYTQVGHDGGTRVRARLAYKGTLAGDTWIFVYFTNGSARNVWSSTLVDSVMAVAAPEAFPHALLSERLIAHALAEGSAGEDAMQAWLRDGSGIPAAELERAINATGYAIRENLGARVALKVFTLNTTLYPGSANAWDSLAECHAALGDTATAEAMYAKSRALAGTAKGN
ncbi:hypothetical protein GCM10027214_11920 [Stenotrophomonas tumulicola]